MLKVWDARTGQEVLAIKAHTQDVRSVAFSPDGERIVSPGNDGTLKVWGGGTRQDVFPFRGHTSEVASVAFSDDGKRIRTRDQNGNRLDFDAASGKPLPPDREELPEGRLRASQPGGHLVARVEGKVVLVHEARAARGRRNGRR